MIDKPLLGEDIYLDPLFADGLVACWLMNEGSGNQIYDLSGNENTGTLVANTLWVPGKSGPALEFDGVGDAVNVGNSAVLNPVQDFTVSAVLNYTQGNFQVFFGKEGAATVPQYIFALRGGGNNTLFLRITAGGTEEDVLANTVIPSDTWFHAAAVYNGATQLVYLNGILDAAPVAHTGLLEPDVGVAVLIGATQPSAPNNPLDGQIGHVMMWDRALTAGEIMQNYRESFWGFRRQGSEILTRM